MIGRHRAVTEEESAKILRLHHAEQWPVGTIAAELGRHHDTIERVLATRGVRGCLGWPHALSGVSVLPWARWLLWPRQSALHDCRRSQSGPVQGSRLAALAA